MKVILSIKPQFADKIFEGSKQFEFRKAIFKNPDIKKVIVYASSPVQKVIGEFEIDQIISNTPLTIWRQTKSQSGISEDYFFEYFHDRDVAYAIKVKKAKLYKNALCLRKDFNLLPPQSFMYYNA
jgi:predicted transcriptional regulator